MQTESFVFDMGVSLQGSTLRAGDNSLYDADGNLAYLLVALPITPWLKAGAGLLPYTTVHYSSTQLQQTPTDGEVKTIYDGTGGINQAFLGAAVRVLEGKGNRPSVHVGVNLNWLTGSIDRAISYVFQGNDTTYMHNKRRYKHTAMNNVLLDFGLQAYQPIGEKYTLGLGLVYKPYADLTISDKALIYTYHNGSETLIDTIFPARGTEPDFDSQAERAQTVGIGLSIERNERWQAVADMTFAGWSGLKYTEGQTPSLFGSSSMIYDRYSCYAVGFQRLVRMDASTYWGRIGWSLGAHLQNGVMHLDLNASTERIDEWGAGAGLVLPMRKGQSLLTLSVGYSSLGSKNILRRDTFTFGISVSSCEHWFFKRKYN